MTDLEDKQYLKSTLLEILHEGECEATFIKKDGSERKMKCTLAMNLIPEDKLPKGSERHMNENQVRVFDLTKQEWRSFLINNLIVLRKVCKWTET